MPDLIPSRDQLTTDHFDACVEAARQRLNVKIDLPGRREGSTVTNDLLAGARGLAPVHRNLVIERDDKRRLSNAYQKARRAGRRQDGGDVVEALTENERVYENLVRLVENNLSDAAKVIIQKRGLDQSGQGFRRNETFAFQEVIADLYDGFFSAQDRDGAPAPSKALPPLAGWVGDYVVSRGLGATLGLNVTMITMPARFAGGGLFAWCSLGHETVGHDVAPANEGFEEEMSGAIKMTFRNEPSLYAYWQPRLLETLCDILCILNMGPAAALGLLGDTLSRKEEQPARLSGKVDPRQQYPEEIVRASVWRAAVERLAMLPDRKKPWVDRITQYVVPAGGDEGRDVGDGLTLEERRESADRLVESVLSSGRETLGKGVKRLDEIQNWKQSDERVVDHVWHYLVTGTPIPHWARSGIYAAHVVAAAVEAVVAGKKTEQELWEPMVGLLSAMYDADVRWGPLSGSSGGDVAE